MLQSVSCGILQGFIQINIRRHFLEYTDLRYLTVSAWNHILASWLLQKNVMIQQFNGSGVWQQSPCKHLWGNKITQAQDSGRFHNCLLLAQIQGQSKLYLKADMAVQCFDSQSRFYSKPKGRTNL